MQSIYEMLLAHNYAVETEEVGDPPVPQRVLKFLPPPAAIFGMSHDLGGGDTPITPDLSITLPNGVMGGAVPTLIVRVKNTGNASMTITGVTVTGDEGPTEVVVQRAAPPIGLDPTDDFAYFLITFVAGQGGGAGPGTYQVNISVEHDAADGLPSPVAFSVACTIDAGGGGEA